MNALLLLLLETSWFFLPAAVANVAPVLVARVSWLNLPLDGGWQWRNRRLLGDNKTVRGVVAGVVFGSITALLQQAVSSLPDVAAIALVVSPSALAAAWWGAWLGLGALFGDALKSFIKRQLDIAPGQPWRPFDQIDVVVGVLLLTQWWWPLSLRHVIAAIILFGVCSFVASVIGVQLKIKKTI